MTIDFAVVSTDENPLYEGFWEIVQKLWKEVVGVHPVLVRITDSDFCIKEYDTHMEIKLPRVHNIDTAFQAQISRLFVTQFFQTDTVLTSDLDMIPLSRNYFVDNADSVLDTQLLIYTADAYGYNNQDRYPMCYNLAKGITYQEILKMHKSFKTFTETLYALNLGWDTDELYYGKCVLELENRDPQRIVKLDRGWREGYATGRIDRSWWATSSIQSRETWVDFHALRPYRTYRQDIDKILNLI